MNTRKLIALALCLINLLLPLSPVLAAAAEPMSLLGVGGGTTTQSTDAGRAAVQPAGAPSAPADDSWLSRAGNWMGRFGRGFVNGIVHAVPNLINQFRENPLETTLMVGGMIALGVVFPPAAIALGGGLLVNAAIQTGGDPEKLGNLAGETAFWAGAGIGGARAIRGLRGTRPGAVAASETAGTTGVRAASTTTAQTATTAGVSSRPVSPRMAENFRILEATNGRRPVGGMCFVAGTLVLTATGLTPIESVKPRDPVMAYGHRAAVVAQGEELDPATTVVVASAAGALPRPAAAAPAVRRDGLVSRPVLATFRREATALVDMTLTSGGAEWTVSGTPNHPFYVPAADRYVEMGRLAVGDRLRADSGRDVVVLRKAIRRGRFAVFNFEVEGAHNYHVTAAAGRPAVLVHNTGLPGTCMATTPPTGATPAGATPPVMGTPARPGVTPAPGTRTTANMDPRTLRRFNESVARREAAEAARVRTANNPQTPDPANPGRPAATTPAPRQPWRIDNYDRVVRGPKGKIYRDPKTGYWWSKDVDGHGGSAWKVFTEEGTGLRWFKDADVFGNFIAGKHKGPSGEFIPWSRTAAR